MATTNRGCQGQTPENGHLTRITIEISYKIYRYRTPAGPGYATGWPIVLSMSPMSMQSGASAWSDALARGWRLRGRGTPPHAQNQPRLSSYMHCPRP